MRYTALNFKRFGNKKLLFLSVVIALILMTLFLIYRGSPASNPSGQSQQKEGVMFDYISDSAVVSPILSHDNNSVWYFTKTDGKLVRKSLEGAKDEQIYPIPEKGLPRFVIWPDTGSDLIMGTENGIYYFNAASGSIVRYPDTVRTISWMPGGQRVAYIWSDQNGDNLSVARPDLSDYNIVTKLPHGSLRVEASPNSTLSSGSFVLFNPSESDALRFAVNGLPGLQEVLGSTMAKDVKYAPDAKSFAFVEEKNNQKSLYLVDVAALSVSKVSDLSEGGAFTWAEDGTLFWSDRSGTIMARNPSGQEKNVLENQQVAKNIVATYLAVGRSPQEMLFVEQGTDRLGMFTF